MKSILLLFLFVAKINCIHAQSDLKIDWPANKYLQNIFNAETNSINPSYNYSNLWDIDGDKKNDSIYFIGNGGAHALFYLQIVLSSDNSVRDFPFIELDMPFMSDKKLLNDSDKNPAVQFVVNDFDNDGVVDLYLNFSSSSVSVPERWRKSGVTTKYIVMHFTKGKIAIRDFIFR